MIKPTQGQQKLVWHWVDYIHLSGNAEECVWPQSWKSKKPPSFQHFSTLARLGLSTSTMPESSTTSTWLAYRDFSRSDIKNKTVFCPDITVMVDWALKSNNQSINQDQMAGQNTRHWNSHPGWHVERVHLAEAVPNEMGWPCHQNARWRLPKCIFYGELKTVQEYAPKAVRRSDSKTCWKPLSRPLTSTPSIGREISSRQRCDKWTRKNR